jgi:hypothetical protein
MKPAKLVLSAALVAMLGASVSACQSGGVVAAGTSKTSNTQSASLVVKKADAKKDADAKNHACKGHHHKVTATTAAAHKRHACTKKPSAKSTVKASVTT